MRGACPTVEGDGRTVGGAQRVELPVLPNSKRRRSGQRGMTRALLFGVKAFFEQHGALDKTMDDVCKEADSATSVCALTCSTGLSLAESVVISAAICRRNFCVIDAFFARHQDLAHYHRPMAGPICYPAFKGEKLTAKDVMAYARALVQCGLETCRLEARPAQKVGQRPALPDRRCLARRSLEARPAMSCEAAAP